MNSILVVDDMGLFRDSIAVALRSAGYTAYCAKDGSGGLKELHVHHPDLILLDLLMPIMDGMAFLRAMRRDPSVANIPVIIITELTDKKYVMEAAQLGVRDYVLKSRVSLDALLDRIKRLLAPKSASTPGPKQNGTIAGKQDSHPRVVGVIKEAGRSQLADIPAEGLAPLLNSQQCIQRIEASMAGKTLSGAVAEVMMLAGRPSAELKDLSALITRDSVLSVRVLQMANSAAFFSRRGSVATVNEAVRNIGATNVRNIAASVGVFDAMPASSPDGFNPIRCWQHSFAVARLCEAFVAPSSPDEAGVAYLVGLCHDLGEIMFRTQFEEEYQSVLEEENRSGAPLEDIERRLLGMTHTEILKVILKCMGLPETIRNPIERFQRTGKASPAQPLVLRALAMAETYGNGLLLASSGSSLISPFTEKAWSTLAAPSKMQMPDGEEIRSQVYCLTAILSRMNAADQAQLLKFPYQKTETRVWLARDPLFSSIDPLALALGELATVEAHDRLPTPAELPGFSCLAIEGSGRNTPGWSLSDIEKSRAANPHISVLWLVNEAVMETGKGTIEPLNAVSIQTIQDAIVQAESMAI